MVRMAKLNDRDKGFRDQSSSMGTGGTRFLAGILFDARWGVDGTRIQTVMAFRAQGGLLTVPSPVAAQHVAVLIKASPGDC